MDIDAILWPQRNFVTLNFPTDPVFYLAVESVLRRHFDYVLTYLYNDAHHDHFHVDQAGQVGFGKSRTKTNYVQAYCAHVLGLPTEVDGVWGPDTEEGLERAQAILEVPGDLGNLNRWKEFLRAAAVHAFQLALQVVDDDPDDEIAGLNRAIEFGMADHPLRKFALARVAGLHQRLSARAAAAAPADAADIPAQILHIAANSSIARYQWRDRGRAPMGYTKGMALTFARVYCKLKDRAAAAVEMAKADTGQTRTDALAHYRAQFQALGMDNSSDGPDTLRHLFVLLMGLGMRESSGKHCEGMYEPDDNTEADTAEAGLFQTSYNAAGASDLLQPLFERYLANPSGFLDVFQEGVTCSPSNWQNHGSGPGKEYQRLSKECPAFAAEFTAVALRHRRNHWGPIKNRKREAEVRPECDEMFREVQAAVDASNLCPV